MLLRNIYDTYFKQRNVFLIICIRNSIRKYSGIQLSYIRILCVTRINNGGDRNVVILIRQVKKTAEPLQTHGVPVKFSFARDREFSTRVYSAMRGERG